MKTQLIIRKWMFGWQVLALAAALVALAGSASAGLVPVFVSETFTGGNSVFTYSVNFSSNGSTESLTAGDFFTLYDVGSVTAGTSPGLTRTQSLLGLTAPLTSPPDSATILNVTSTYNGAMTITADTTITEVLTFPGILTTTPGYYSSTDTIALGKNSQAGLVLVPLVAVPEPSTWAALGLGMAGVVAVGLRRRRLAA